MYNIAICISGEPRHYSEGADSIKKLLTNIHEDINVDVFYHFWDNVTKTVARQREYDMLDDPIKNLVNKEAVKQEYKPTIGICESKDTLDNDINIAFSYLQDIIKLYNVKKFPPYKFWKHAWQNISDFNFKVKNTNIPTLSQLISFFRCQGLRIQHENRNNIKYDLIIRTRSDIKFVLPKKIHYFLQEKHVKAVHFKKLKVCSDSVLYGEPGFYVFSSHIVENKIFDDYLNKTKKLMFRVKEKDNQKLHVLTDHSIIPEYFTSQRCPIEAPGKNWDWSLKSSKINL